MGVVEGERAHACKRGRERVCVCVCVCVSHTPFRYDLSRGFGVSDSVKDAGAVMAEVAVRGW